MIAIGLLFIRMLCDCFKPQQQLAAEILVLRHQLNVLQQRSPRRPHLRWVDRALFIWLYRRCPRILNAMSIVRPATVLRWHRRGFTAYWRWKSRSAGGRPRIAKELLTTDIKWENGTVTHYQTSVNVGAGLRPIRQMTVSADIHNVFGQGGKDPTMHYGVEFKPIYGLALRAGLSDENKTAGIGIGIGQLIIDYAYLGGAYNRTHMIGASWTI